MTNVNNVNEEDRVDLNEIDQIEKTPECVTFSNLTGDTVNDDVAPSENNVGNMSDANGSLTGQELAEHNAFPNHTRQSLPFEPEKNRNIQFDDDDENDQTFGLISDSDTFSNVNGFQNQGNESINDDPFRYDQ